MLQSLQESYSGPSRSMSYPTYHPFQRRTGGFCASWPIILGLPVLEISVPNGGTLLSRDATRATWILSYDCGQSFRLSLPREQLARRGVLHPRWDTDPRQQEVELPPHSEVRGECVWESSDPPGCLLILSCPIVSVSRHEKQPKLKRCDGQMLKLHWLEEKPSVGMACIIQSWPP